MRIDQTFNVVVKQGGQQTQYSLLSIAETIKLLEMYKFSTQLSWITEYLHWNIRDSKGRFMTIGISPTVMNVGMKFEKNYCPVCGSDSIDHKSLCRLG